jgi:hypothetical protein
MWQNSKEVFESILHRFSATQIQKLESAFALRSALHAAIPRKGYKPEQTLAKSIKLTGYGENCVANAKIDRARFSEDEILCAAFVTFYHHDYLISIDDLNIDEISSSLQSSILSGNIALPDRLGRVLYDRFNDDVDTRRANHLEPPQVDALLVGCEPGVYQVGTLVFGPLGVTNSLEPRYMPPTRSIPLWHCPDTGCQQVHTVALLTHTSGVAAVSTQIRRAAERVQGRASEWLFPHVKLQRVGTPRAREFYNLPSMLAEALGPSELQLLLATAIRSSEGPRLRSILERSSKQLARGSGDEVAGRLTKNSQFQLLMTLDTLNIVGLLDDLVRKRIIKIPPAETRRGESSPPTVSAYDSSATLSQFGIRTDRRDPPLYLASILWSEYEAAGQTAELGWRCKKKTENIDRGIALEYMRDHGPSDLVRHLILPSGPITLAISKRLHLGLVPDEPDDELINRILWKCGFNPPRYDQTYARTRMQLRQLREETLSHGSKLSDDARDSIRSKGVNVFVSLEKILEDVIAFNVWVLSSDHFVDTGFSFNSNDAVAQVAEILGPIAGSSSHQVTWSVEGGNTLGTLLTYARAAAEWMSGLLTRERASTIRPNEDMPHYTDDEEKRFPFVHKELWADTSTGELAEFVQAFENFVKDLELSRLAEVRNGLDHYRETERFPALDLILACESRLSAALDRADINRLLPKLFWRESRRLDEFGLTEDVFVDYSGSRVSISGPPSVTGIQRPSSTTPVIIPFGNLLGDPNSEIMFLPRENSHYSQMWSNYPRRSSIIDRKAMGGAEDEDVLDENVEEEAIG